VRCLAAAQPRVYAGTLRTSSYSPGAGSAVSEEPVPLGTGLGRSPQLPRAQTGRPTLLQSPRARGRPTVREDLFARRSHGPEIHLGVAFGIETRDQRITSTRAIMLRGAGSYC